MASIVKAERFSLESAPGTPPTDTAVLMRGGGRRMRVISKTKLPRMNNSERGKFYRQKYREYEEQLERDVQRLQGEVHELQRLLELRQLLPQQHPCVSLDEVRAATQVVYEGLVRLHERWASIDEDAASPAASRMAGGSDEIRSAECVHALERLQLCSSQSEHFIARHQNTSTPLVFKLESVEIQGCNDSRIVVAHGRLYAQYHPAILEELFPVIRYNKHLSSRLLAREVAYNCTYRFHTSALFGASDLSFISVDVDAVAGLLDAIPNLHCVEALLSPMVHSNFSDVKAEGDTTGSRITNNCYDRSPTRHTPVSEHPSKQDCFIPVTPPRPMTLAFILS
ncbi:hypothetical protein KRP22_001504 [Phytophthora ramorum]|uniref:uncharacterized protein n=1 Tax=Phytophthora ramorum TaxID=164328 RepID=UPI0030A65EBC|nr:hypothetical protein KRP23_9798 [Phytophthora ramorum]KAH7504041.1 hypothetical protein KRP22_7087 [Phytophthora ramorum]